MGKEKKREKILKKLRELDPELEIAAIPPATAPPLVQVCIVLLAWRNDQLWLALEPADPEQSAHWRLPARRLQAGWDGDLHASIMRLRHETTGLINGFTKQVCTCAFAPSGRNAQLLLTYLGFCRPDEAERGEDRQLRWFSLAELSQTSLMLPDHQVVVEAAREYLLHMAESSPALLLLLSPEFTFSDLQKIYESVLGRELDRSAFRRRFLEPELLIAVTNALRRGSNRPAQLYRAKPGAEEHRFARLLLNG